MRRRSVVILLGTCAAAMLAAAGPAACSQEADDIETAAGPLSPADSRATFQLAPGLHIELAAQEPQIVDPVAIRFDETGRMWVVEMRDYPHGPAEGEAPRSRIRCLEDRDEDGRYETAWTFADSLLFVTGMQPWRDGIIVTLAGRVAFMADRNGDGRADHDETLYTGFAQENSQLRANHPRLGLDGWIYIANGLRGGKVVDARVEDAPIIDISGRDFRFHPETGAYEAITGIGQFGLTFDDFGNRFVCSNRNPVKHIVLEDRYLRAGGGPRIPSAAHDVAAWGEQSRIFPISRAWTTSNLHAGQFTAACGVLIYRGNLLPRPFRNNVFICDPTGNLVHREIMANEGPTFTSRPAREGAEFLAATDEWFRPVNLHTGPDGALYVVDMYRAVIEHPQFMPTELKTRPDLYLGTDRGRIWRIVPEGSRVPAATAGTPPRDAYGWITWLAHPNGWHRDTALRKLYEDTSVDVSEALRSTLFGNGPAHTRVAAAWLLHAREPLDQDTVRRMLADSDPHLRSQAVRIAESSLISSDNPEREGWRETLWSVADDPDVRVRFRLALALSRQPRSDEVDRLAVLARTNEGQPWMGYAAALAARESPAQLAAALLQEDERPRPLIRELAGMCRSRDAAEKQILIRGLLRVASDEALQREGLLALRPSDALVRAACADSPELLANWQQLSENATRTASRLLVEDRASTRALESIDLLVLIPGSADLLEELATDAVPAEARLRAVTSLGRSGTEPDRWERLIGRLRTASPAWRRAVLDQVLASPERTARLLDALEGHRLSPTLIEPAQASRLTRVRDAELRARAAAVLAAVVNPDRQAVLEEWRGVLEMAADPRRGRAVFQQHCATCHQVGGIGVNVAPDISDSRTKTPAQILTDILQPNRAIDGNYVSYAVLLLDGRQLAGILSSETATSVTLRQPEGVTQVVPRSEIDELYSNGVSLMPEGLERQMTRQDMADLVSYIKNWRYLDGRTPVEGIAPDGE